MKHEIGILAYGSLIDDAGPEIEPLIRSSIREITTPFCIEYERTSKSRDGAPTLIPSTTGGSPVKAVIYVLDTAVSLAQAKGLIWRRETGLYGEVSYEHKTRPGPNQVIVEEIPNLGGVATVLYTKIGNNLADHSPETLADLAIQSARAHSGKVERDGISYLIAALDHGILTPLTEAYERAILAKTKTSRLQDALSVVRGPRVDPRSPQGQAIIRAFCEECVWARAIRKHFAELFESGTTRHQLLAETARTFFQDLNVVLLEYVMLQQCKLTDPAEMSGHANLTSEHILEFEWPATIRKQLAWQNIMLQQFRKKIAVARSKLVAHSDLRSRLRGAPLGSFAEGEEAKFWTALEQFASTVHAESIGGPFEINATMPDGDSLNLLRALADAADYDDRVKENASVLTSHSRKRRFDKL